MATNWQPAALSGNGAMGSIRDDCARPKRTYIPLAARREAGDNQGNVCPCGCGTPVWKDAKRTKSAVEWDHVPALRLRDINEDGTDYIPPQNDPRYLVGRCRQSHRKKTSGTGATTAGTDTGYIKKERKRNKPPKRKASWPKRKMQSRNTFEKRRK